MTISATTLRQAPNLVSAFAQVCRSHPERVAIRDRGNSVTYRQLARRVRGIAAGLATRCPQPTSRAMVAVALEPGTDAVCAILATLATGAAYLPLDITVPDSYLTSLLADARPQAVIARGPAVACPGAAAVDIDELAAGSPRGRAALRGERVAGQDPAYAIFTSGSTGRPKGVLLPQTAMLHSTAARIDAYGMPDRVPLLHSPAVDVYSGVLFWALLTGATLVIGPGGLRDVPATVDLLHEEEITDLVYLSSLYPAFLDYAALKPPSTLRRVVIGSDRWGESVIDRHALLLPKVSLHNEYGPSEAAVWTSQARVWDGATGRRAPLTIGRPVSGTDYLLLADDRTPLAPGERGELYITGAQLALGYLGDSESTAERFVTLPSGERAYRTGDLAEISAEGDFVFAGRVDRQLKVQGNRIEPAQVEAVLMSHPHVGLAHVIARTDAGPGKVLTAYLTPRADAGSPLAEDVRALAARRLPAHMVPSAWVVLDSLPRTTGGKIDESALPAPAACDLPVDDRDRPRDELEAELAQAMGEILHGPPPGVTRRLTGAGASSLALMRLAARIACHHQAVVPVSVLFAEPTIRQIAAHVRAAQPSDRPALVPARHAPHGTPLSWQQRQIWFLGKLAPDSLAYNTQCSLHLDGALDVRALQEALSHVVARHEILRTTFHGDGDKPVQVVHSPWPVVLKPIDLTALPAADRETALRQHLAEQTRTVFDTARLPLVRWHLYRLDERRWTLFQVEHHFVHDGWSANVLLAEIRDAYAAFAERRPPTLPALPVQYRDWAVWQRDWARTQDYAAQRAYWQRHLDDVPVQGVTFTPDAARPPRQTFDGACLRAHLPADTLDALDEVCAARRITRFAVFLTAFELLVRLNTGAEDFVIGSALANRRQAETAPLLGMFVNALPLRLRVGENDTIADVAAHTMAVLLGAQDHQEFPLVEIIKDLGLPRDPARNPLFQLMFAFHDTPRPLFEAAGVRGRLHIDHNGSAKNDLNVVLVPRPPAHAMEHAHDGVDILWEYNTTLFQADSSRALLESFARIVTALTNPHLWDQPATDLEVFDPTQSRQIAARAAGVSLPPAHVTLHAGVDAQIVAAPHQVAVVHGNRRITYQELDHAATAIERRLDDAGITTGTRVALACGPGPDHVAACLAVLRRGGSFVCVDPHEPAARLSQLLADAEPEALVCSSRTAAALRATAPRTPLVVAGQQAPHAAAAGPNPVRVGGEDAAYLVYTSGSTGKPKAVVASHTNAVTALTARTAHFGSAPARTLITLPLQFDVATSMLFFTLWNGGTLVFPDHEDSRDPEAVRALVDRHQVSHVNFVASYYRHFLATLPLEGATTLRAVAIGGEPCSPHLVREHAARLPGVTLDNEYGPTETTVWCAASRVHDPDQPGRNGPVTIGRPLANYALYVVDPQLRPRPVGARGELVVAGPGVCAGYLNRPELTAQRFVTPGIGPLSGTRLYRTGDEGRLRADGTFEVFGRLDEQVKIRGYRIELGEIRQCLETHPSVRAAHVLADHDTDPAGRLIGYTAVAGASDGLAGALRAWVAERLPAYMVPSCVVVVDHLPLTATGKVDRAALPRPHPAAASAFHVTAETPGPAETAVLAVWRELLSHDRIGPDDAWFALGGDSLTAIKATARLREKGLHLDVGQFLQAQTIRNITALTSPTASKPVEAERRPGGTRLPLTPIQAWFFAQDFAEPHHFNQARLFEIPADAPRHALRTAIAACAGRHDAFRTRFTRGADGWSAHLEDEAPVVELTEHTAASGPDQRAMDQLHRSLDIHHGRLWAAQLFTDPVGKRRWLHLVAHHLIVDAVSWDILARDLARALTRPDTPLPAAPGITAPAPMPGDEESAYWAAHAAADKPALRTSGAERAAYGRLRHHHVTMSAHATAHLLELAQRGRVTLPAVLLAALHRALKPLTRGDGLYAFVEGHGRDDVADADQVVGWLTSLYPVLLHGVRQAPRGGELLATADAFRAQLAAVPRGGAGYAAARYCHPRSALGTRLAAVDQPEITFNYLGHRTSAGDSTPAVRVRAVPSSAGEPIGTANVLPTVLHVTAAVHEGPSLKLHVSFDAGAFVAGTVDTACARLREDLERIARLEPLTTPPPHGTGEGRRPHFLVHPVDGQVHWYAALAQSLGRAGWDSYGLRADTGPEAAVTIPELAARYTERIRQVQPTGPYTLTGWSFGAAVAYEMARILQADGQRVPFLLLLDPPPLPLPDGPSALVDQITALLPDLPVEQTAHSVAHALDAPVDEQPARLVAALHLTAPHNTFVLTRLETLLRHHRALATWTPTGTVEHLHLVRPATTTQPCRPWLAHGRRTTRTIVPGDHHSMLDGEALDHLIKLYDNSAVTDA